MERFEFKVVPAPRRGEKARGVKTSEERFALALSTLMNQMGAEGWDYIRADALPCDERSGLTGTKTSFFNMLVFRRALPAEAPRAAVFGRTSGPVVTAPAASVAEPAAAEPATPALNTRAPEGNSAPALGPARSGVAAE